MWDGEDHAAPQLCVGCKQMMSINFYHILAIALIIACLSTTHAKGGVPIGNLKCFGIEYVVEELVGGIVEYEKYKIEDTDKTNKDWQKLQNDFKKGFTELSFKNHKDYELPEWHHGTKVLYVYLYNEKFFNKGFIPTILHILKANGNCYAEFECYDNKQKLIGFFQVYKNKIRFDKSLESRGLIKQLCD